MEHIKQFPHCDSRILHKPGECEFCDDHPDWQELRQTWGIAFTGQQVTEDEEGPKLPCPADLARGGKHALWHGNRAAKNGEVGPLDCIWVYVSVQGDVQEVKEADVLRAVISNSSMTQNYRYVPTVLYNVYVHAVAERDDAVATIRRCPKAQLKLTSALHDRTDV